MGGKVEKFIWNILTLLKWEAKLAHWSGTKWTDSMFYITTDWKSIMNREKWKSEKRDKYSFPPQIRRLVQNIWNLIFSDFNPLFFCYLLIFVKKVLKANIFAFNKTILLIPSLTLTNMSNRFFGLFLPVSASIFSKLDFS